MRVKKKKRNGTIFFSFSFDRQNVSIVEQNCYELQDYSFLIILSEKEMIFPFSFIFLISCDNTRQLIPIINYIYLSY